MKKVIIMRGLPGSGKSTYAKKLVKEFPNAYKRINRDELRAMFDDGYTSRGNERFVRQVRDVLITKALEAGKHVIVDDLNLSAKNETRVRQIVQEFNQQHDDKVIVEVKQINTPVDECIRRDATREKPVGPTVIHRLNNQFFDRSPQYGQQDESLPKAIICDLDGTLALLKGRNPYTADDCDKDELNRPVADLVKLKAGTGTKILLLSGRLDTYQDKTEKWLAIHKIPYDFLKMRAAGDTRKDAVIKAEFYDTHVKGKYFIEFVLDDRNQVVDLWRNTLRLPCFQVFYGNF